jgi:hypothetical protein
MNPAPATFPHATPAVEFSPRPLGLHPTSAQLQRSFESFTAGLKEGGPDTANRPSAEPFAAQADAEKLKPLIRSERRPGAPETDADNEPASWSGALWSSLPPPPQADIRLLETAPELQAGSEVAAATALGVSLEEDSLLSLRARDLFVEGALQPEPDSSLPPAALRTEARARTDESRVQPDGPASAPNQSKETDAGKLRLDSTWTATSDEAEITVVREGGAPIHNQPAAGTTVAQQQSDMKPTLQQEEIAGSPVPLVTARQGLSSPARLGAHRPGTGAGVESPSGEELSRSQTQWVGESATGTSLESEALDAVARLEPARDLAPLILEQVVHFRRSSLEALDVVLKPDRGTELHLQLTQHGGQIEVQIRCERGDSHQLNTGWARLQESLAQQGIRLAPLEGGSLFAGGEQFGRQQQGAPHHPSDPTEWWPDPRNQAVGARPISATSTIAPLQRAFTGPQRVLESWA